MKLPQKLQDKLQNRKAENAFRELSDFENKIDFFSNDYLGLAKLPYSGNEKHGSTGSRLLSGNSNEIESVESELAKFFNQESGLIYNSGYDANLGVFSSIPQRGDTILYDELCHASIRDGIRLSNAQAYSFRHNDIEHLKKRLQNVKGDVYVAVESIYSMDGDESPLKEIANICKVNNAFLIVDEAHSGGIYGAKGEGLVSCLKLDELVFIKLITFGKAFGSHGGLVLSDASTRDYLINFSRSFIYTTAMSLNSVKRIQQVVMESEKMDVERQKLYKLIEYFKSEATNKNVKLIKSNSPIQCILVTGTNEVKRLEKNLQDEGFAVKAIQSPTVKKGEERIRICLHSFNTKNQIEELFKAIN